ncbi:MAG: hypothetical protein LWW79_13370 [Holophagaceae bacterium]|nr:hypothetical protein [Holophagaceae bacterium]
MCRAAVLILPLLLVSCMRRPEVARRAELPVGSEVAVILFQGCLIPDQEGCQGLGVMAANAFAHRKNATSNFSTSSEVVQELAELVRGSL